MLFRILGVAALSLFLLADATAQNTPGKRRAAKKTASDRTIPLGKTMLPGMGAVTPADVSKEASPAQMATDAAPMRAEEAKDHGNVYAAPGQPVNVKDGKVAPYDGPAVQDRKEEQLDIKRRETNTLDPAK